MTNTILTMAAMDYLAAGLHIIALAGKRPNAAVHGDHWSYEDSFHGRVETPEEMEVLDRALSKEMGTTGIAILIPPDFLVADVDTERAADLLVELGGTPTEDTIAARTKNGLHIWYWWPGANRNRWLGDGQQPDPTRTLLLKGLGGYVVAPPSLHYGADGEPDGQYLWGQNPLVVGGRLMMPEVLPPGAQERIKMEDQWLATEPEKEPITTFVFEVDPAKPWWQWQPIPKYATEGLERAIINAADGNQNNVIHWAAMVCREEGVPQDIAMERLMDAARKGNHPERRARETIRGAYKRSPRG